MIHMSVHYIIKYIYELYSFMFKSYDIGSYGTFLSEEGQRGVSQSMKGNQDTPGW